MDRRKLLKMAATGTAATATALVGTANAGSGARIVTVRSPGTLCHAYGLALEKLSAYAERELTAAGAPGMTFCLVDAEGLAAVGAIGWADIDRRVPVSLSHLFQIGSISKSFGALCVYRLADEGRIDLDAPLSRYLPDAPLPAQPILVQQILSHTAGLPRSSPVFPRVPDQRLWTGFTPGTNFSYSNTGYRLIGMLVEKICGKPYPLALRDLVVRPLGITGMREALQASDRARYAVGYSPLDASGPNMRRVPLGPTQWINSDTAEANIGTTADGMTRYLQYLIGVGQGRGAPLFSDGAAKRFSKVVEAAAVFGSGAGYASGLEIINFGGNTIFQHIGTICGFTSSIIVDPVAGVGCFVSVNAFNGGYRADAVTKYACRLFRHVREGGAAPSPTGESELSNKDSAQDYAGTYMAPDGDRFQLVARSGRLFLSADGKDGHMQAVRGHCFLSDHPRFGAHFFDFERSGDVVIAVWFGTVLYGRGAVVPQPAVPPELAALQGIYLSSDPWSGWWRSVVAQGERLVIENIAIYGSNDTLRRKGEYWCPEGADNPCERIRFDAVLNGVPQRLNVSGRDMWRFNEI